MPPPSEEAVYLTHNDRNLLQEIIDQHRRTMRSRGRKPWQDDEHHQAPEVYLAKPQDSNGIPGLEIDVGGCGTAEYDQPGRADCDLYQIVEQPWGPDVQAISHGPVPVYNHCEERIGTKDEWVLAVRNKMGHWSGVARNEIRLFELLANWFPPVSEYDDNYTILAEDRRYDSTETIWFPTWGSGTGEPPDWYREPMFFGIGRTSPWTGCAGTLCWCQRRNLHWEIISGTFETICAGKAAGTINQGSAGTVTIWWPTDSSWTMASASQQYECLNWCGPNLSANDEVMVGYAPDINKWYIIETPCAGV